MVKSVKTITKGETCLMFTHAWAKENYGQDMIMCRADSRGINHLQSHRNAFVAIHGNPPTTAVPALKYVAEKYQRDVTELLNAWCMTYKLEAALQDVFRTGIRSTKTDEHFRFFVADHATANYLKHFLPSAEIDTTLETAYRIKKERKPREKSDDCLMVEHLLRIGTKTKDILKVIDVSRSYIQKKKATITPIKKSHKKTFKPERNMLQLA